MTVVTDSSVVAAALVDSGSEGVWAEEIIASNHIVAPHLMPAEVANILRRGVLAGDLSPDIAALAHMDLLSLPVDLFAFDPFGMRVWELRDSVTAYDAWYVALAEALEAPLATLDRRLARAHGPRCAFITP